MRKAILFAVALLLSAACTGVAFAQSAAFATITGRVLDPKGATVPDISVTATNAETGLVRTTKTTSEGLYRFDNLAPGIYNVTVEAAGFAKAEANSIKLQVGEQRDVNFSLELAGQKQTVVVTSEMPLVETTKTDVSTVVDDKAVADLPTTTSFNSIGGVANDYQGLAASAPGVKYDYTGNSSDLVGPGNVNDRGITINVDGGNISDQSTSARDSLGASLEEVKEFQVLTTNYNAEYGQAGNIVLNVITKSGTNQIHGDGHGYFRGRNFGASDFFYNQTSCDPTITGPGSCDSKADAGFPTARAPFFKHEYGFTAGGPFKRDRLFWFTSLEDVQQGAPATTRPFGNSVTVQQPTKELMWSSKVDAKLSEKHTLTIRFNEQRDLSDNLIVQTGENTDPSGFVSQVVHDHTLNVGMVSTPTLHTVNEARFFWHRTLSATPTKSILPGEALPNAYVGADFCCPQAGLNHRFQYVDNLSYTRGTHTIKTGVNISHYPFDSLFTQFRFGRYENFVPGSCTNTFFPSANGLCPTQFTVGIGPAFVHVPDNIYGAYVQDTWQIIRNVTLNYGLRYDIEDGAFTGGTISRVQDPSAPANGCFQQNGLISACGSDKNNWQPRVGIAWSPDYQTGVLHWLFGDHGKSVVRMAGAEVTEMAYLNVVLDSRNFDGVNLFTTSIKATSVGTDGTTTGQKVLNAYPNSPSDLTLSLFKPLGFFGRIRPISPNIKNPEVRMASFSITRQIGPSFVWSVGYQGVFGFGLFGEKDTNFPTPVVDTAHTTTPSGAPATYYYLPGRPDSSFAAIRTNNSDRHSAYNSLVVTAQKRLSHHTQFQASYTWSKTLSDGEDFFGLSEPANPLASLRLDRSPAQQDIRHLANFNFVVDSENLFHTPVVNQVFNNWTFSLLGTLQSGRPYPVSTGDGAFAGSAFPALGSETNQRPNICSSGSALAGCAGAPAGALVATNIASEAGSNLAISQNGVAACMSSGLSNCSALQTTWLAPAGASGLGPVDSYTFDPVDFQYISGNLGRNAGLTPPLYRFDISLLKSFKIPKWESSRLELKLDAFNVFNHPLFILNNANDVLSFLALPSMTTTGGAPNPNFNCAASCINPYTGLYLGANGQPLTLSVFRAGRFDKNLNVNAANFGLLGDPAATVTPRVLQISFRFRW